MSTEPGGLKRVLRRRAPLGLSAALALLAGGPAFAQYCENCVDLEVDESVIAAGEPVRVSISIDASRLDAPRADGYLAALRPDNRVEILRRIPDWEVKDQAPQPMEIDPARAGLPGEYRLYLVLAEPGSDPLSPAHWISADSEIVVLLPPESESGATPTSPASVARLPEVVTRGGGEIYDLPASNSLQALERAYAAGQRFFELDFSWTADRHLVLLQDWEQSFHRFFPEAEGEGRLSRARFQALHMVFGLEQLDVDELAAWLDRHPEVRVVTDIREDNESALFYIAARAGEALPRIIPQILSSREYERVKAMGYRHVILALDPGEAADEELLEFVADHELLAVSVPTAEALQGETARLLAEKGAFVYAHPVNHPALFALLRRRGVSGIFADRLPP